MECYRCHKLGHFQFECPTWDKEANYAELGEEEEMSLMSCVEMKGARRDDVCFLDSGCSNHMCSDKYGCIRKGQCEIESDGITHVTVSVFCS